MNAHARVSPVFQTNGDTTGDFRPTATKAPEAGLWMLICGSHPLQGWPLIDVIGNVGPIPSPTGFRAQTGCIARCSPLLHTFRAPACQFAVTDRRASPPFSYTTRQSALPGGQHRFCAVLSGPFCACAHQGSGLTLPTENRHG